MTQYLTSLLAELFATTSRPARTARPRLEGLEGRLSPATLVVSPATLGGFNPQPEPPGRVAAVEPTDRIIIIVGGKTGQTAFIPVEPQKAAVPGSSIAPQTPAQAAAVDYFFTAH
jgi:hypothetical protein